MYTKHIGKLYLILSALVYGIAPVLAKVAYESGVNEITLSFLRAFLALPVLLASIKLKHISLKLRKKELVKVIILSGLGCSLSITLLYISYNFISAGLATTLHFIYPILIIVASAAIYREKISKNKVLAALIVTVGIFFFARINSAADRVGIILAVLSGVFYSFYILYLDKSGLKDMDYIKLTFYTMLIMSVVTFAFGIATDSISFFMNSDGWFYAFAISIIVASVAVPLLQLGIRIEGAATAGIFSAIEPITTIIFGAVFLGEYISFLQIIGGILILMGVVLSQIESNEG